MPDLAKKRDRERLKTRPEPYWQRLRKGGYLGFRRGSDTWIARYRDRTGKQNFHALAAADFDTAKQQAEDWLEQVSSGVVAVAKGTIREALETYLAWLVDQGRQSTAETCKKRFEAIVYSDPIADVLLVDLTRGDMQRWRDRLRPGRQPRSINRHVRSVVAALNCAHWEGFAGNPKTWRLKPLADDIEDIMETAVILDPAQRHALIAAAEPDAAAFCRGLEITGARPKELAAATVADLDITHGTIKLMHRKGRKAKLRARQVVLTDDGVAFMKQQAAGKLPAALLFTCAGKEWDRFRINGRIKKAIAAHNAQAQGNDRIPPTASAYSFRHARISELLQVHGVDPLTVAMQTGTSVKMIEKAYFSFIPSAMRDKLSQIAEA